MLKTDLMANVGRAYSEKLQELMGYEKYREWCGANDCNFNLFWKDMENKLKELMGEQDFIEFSKCIARTTFFEEIKQMPDGDFKKFCLDNFETITQ